jgi:hypothetical protein
MKPLLPITLAGLLLLYGCPDTKVPKAPPKVPEPKAASGVQQTPLPAQLAALHVNARRPA